MTKLSMRKSSLLGVAVAATLAVTGCNQEVETAAEPAAEVELDTTEKKVTYIVGYNMAKQAKANGLNFEQDVMAAAIKDVLEDKEPRIAQAEQQEIMMSFQEEQQAKRDEENKAVADANMQESEAFLEENKAKEGVETTESGLQYKVLSEGEEGAESPTQEDTVKVHYHGTLADGTVFDSSIDRGQPVSFPVKGVIKGWVEALQLMSVGDKYELYIPPDLAYGEAGTAGVIGPNQALVFEVELLEVNPDTSDAHGGHGHGDEATEGEASAEESGE